MISPRRSPLKRSAIKRSNPKRKKREFARTYHSNARVEFIRSLPCAVCPRVGLSENAHIETGGTGRKADYAKIIPLCEQHHRWLHQIGKQHFEYRFQVDLDWLARDTERRWLTFLVGSDE